MFVAYWGRDQALFRIDVSSSRPNFKGSLLLVDITFRSVIAKHHSHTCHTYPFTESTLSRSDAHPPYWMKVTAMALINLPVLLYSYNEVRWHTSLLYLPARHSVVLYLLANFHHVSKQYSDQSSSIRFYFTWIQTWLVLISVLNYFDMYTQSKSFASSDIWVLNEFISLVHSLSKTRVVLAMQIPDTLLWIDGLCDFSL